MEISKTRRRPLFKCLRCIENRQPPHVNERYRMVDHLQKHHFALDQVPFYCSLCLFRCITKSALVKHVTDYKRHIVMVREEGCNDVDPQRYFVENPYPREPKEGFDYEALAAEPCSYGSQQLSEDPLPSKVGSSDLHIGGESDVVKVSITPQELASILEQRAMRSLTATQPTFNLPPLSPPCRATLMYDPTRPGFIRQPATIKSAAPATKPGGLIPFEDLLSASVAPTESCVVVKQFSASVGGQTTLADSLDGLANPGHDATDAPAYSARPPNQITPILRIPDITTSWSNQPSKVIPEVPNRSNLNTPLLDELVRPSSSTRSVVEDITDDLLGLNETAAVFSPILIPAGREVVTNSQGTQTEQTKKTTSEAESVSASLRHMEKTIEVAVGKLTAAVDWNSRAVRNLDETTKKIADSMANLARSIDRMSEEQRRWHRRPDEAQEAKKPRLEDKENIKDNKKITHRK
jgi:hypothetical protein